MGLIDRIIKNEVKKLVRIKDTFNDRYDYLRLDKNERLLPFSNQALRSFKEKITSEAISGYGELGKTYSLLSDYLGVDEDQLFLAAGSDLAVKSVYEVCVDKDDSVVLHAPCYAMYKVYAKMFGAKTRLIPVGRDWKADIDSMLDACDAKTRIFALENPNGFVGTGYSLSELERVAYSLKKKNIIFLVDEVYYYVEHSRSAAISLIRKYPNLVISQSFSKGHGLAGLRIGYLIGDPELIGFISRVRPMHEITSLTALAVEWVLEHPGMLKEFQRSIKESKAYLKKELFRLEIHFKDTHANFMLLYFPDEGRTKDIAQRLRRRKILIRRPFEEEYLRGWSRVCVGALSDSKKFIRALKKLLR